MERASCRSAFAHRLRYSPGMEQTSTPNLSPSEHVTLRHVGDGEWYTLDWLAIQRLKRMGLIEERDGIPMTTKEGQRALGRIAAST